VIQSFESKVAVVTGAASGIGLALCRALGREGCRVVMADIEGGALQVAAERLSTPGTEVLAVETDVSSIAALERLAARTLERFSRVDLLFNNAGVSTFNPQRDQTLADWKWVLDVNLWGVIHGLHVFLPILRSQGGPAHVVNTASIAGVLSGVACLGPYAVSKAGVVSISETLRIELAAEGSPIGVSVVCPANTDTAVLESERNRPGHRELRSEAGEGFRKAMKIAFKDPGALQPEDVAEQVLSAVRKGNFWIFTHPALRPVLEARVSEMLNAYPGVA
jgi:NAD(P)-dependent dehydrogenase (short-subunit alcohol dehydrogenase family)